LITRTFCPHDAYPSNAYAIYQYPYSPEYWYERAKVTQVPVIREAVLSVPGQVTASVEWLRDRPWADPEVASENTPPLVYVGREGSGDVPGVRLRSSGPAPPST
jgi:hypothetical protein